jgi:hypothetical protein
MDWHRRGHKAVRGCHHNPLISRSAWVFHPNSIRITFHSLSTRYLVLSTKVYLTNIYASRYPEPQTWIIHFPDLPNLGISSLLARTMDGFVYPDEGRACPGDAGREGFKNASPSEERTTVSKQTTCIPVLSSRAKSFVLILMPRSTDLTPLFSH